MDSTSLLELIDSSQAAHEVTANNLFAAGSTATAYGRHAEACAGLTWGYYGTRFGGAAIPNGSNLCGASTTTYKVAHLTTGAPSFATTTTNWNDTAVYGRCYKIVSGPTTITSWEDHRLGPGGVFATAAAPAAASAELKGLTFTSETATTTDADPGAGKFKWNHATQASATVLYFDDTTADGASLTAYWASLGATGYIYMQQADDAAKWQLWRWTAATVDGTGYRKFTVALQAAVGSIATAKTVLCAFNSAPQAGAASRIGLAFEKEIALSDLTTAITTGTTKGYWRPAFAATGVSARLSLRVASSSGIPTVDMNKAGATMMSTKLTIDVSELTSVTAAVPVVMSSTTFAIDDLIEFDIDVAGTGSMGLIVTVTGLYA